MTTVVPTYNEGDRLRVLLLDWADAGAAHPSTRVDLIVVDDGSSPANAECHRAAVEEARQLLSKSRAHHSVRYIQAPGNRGKGAAIRQGWAAATHETAWLGFVDADGAISAHEYWRLADQLPSVSAAALCGIRLPTAGRSLRRSAFRAIQGRTFAAIVEQLFRLGCFDTQCGVKFFRADVLRPLLAELREERWLLDIEVLWRVRSAGGNIAEVPIDCHERGGSALVFGIDAARMLAGLIALRTRLRR